MTVVALLDFLILILFLVEWELVLRPLFGLLYHPQMTDDDCGAVGRMRIGRGNLSTRRKPARATLSTTHPT
jgi:hypothetical protein